MAYEAIQNYPSYTDSYPESDPYNGCESATLDRAIALGGLQSVGLTFQRLETVVGSDGQEYTEIVPFTLR